MLVQPAALPAASLADACFVQLGFLVAVVTEMLVSRPGQGAIFQLLDDPHILGVVGPAALGLVGIAAVRARVLCSLCSHGLVLGYTRARLRARARACVRVCVRACVRACILHCTSIRGLAISKSGVQALGAVSKRSNKLLTEAVFAALTSASASRKLSSGHQRLNTALDRVFDTVLSAEFVRANFASLEMEDFI